MDRNRRKRIGVKDDIVRPVPSTHLLKNTGLAHLHLIQSKHEYLTNKEFLPLSLVQSCTALLYAGGSGLLFALCFDELNLV